MQKKFWWLPNALSFSRMLGSPSIAVAAITGQHEWAFGLCVFFGLTDVFDGAFAIWLKAQTELGSIWIDPLADYSLGLSVLTGWALSDGQLHYYRIPVAIGIALIPTILKPIKELDRESSLYGPIHFFLPHFYLVLVSIFLYLYALEAYGPWTTNTRMAPVGLIVATILGLWKSNRFYHWYSGIRKR